MTIPELMITAEADAFTSDLLVKIGDATPDLLYAKDLQSRMIFANRAVLTVLGKTWDEIRGRSDDEWHDNPEEGRRFVEADARVMASGQTEKLEEMLTGVDGLQTYLSTKSPLRAKDGSVIGLFGSSMNITEQKNAEALQQMLVNELDHRVKNMLSLVQVMARQTFKPANIDKAIWDAFEGRLISMSKAHGMLTRQNWVGADIADVVAEGLLAHGGQHADCFQVNGPSAWLDAQTALALAMAFHELGTNAIKYGALSTAQGRVAITWNVAGPVDGHGDGEGNAAMLDLRWQESGGPAVAEPSHRGFGSRLIQQAFAHNGTDLAEVRYLPGGIEFHVRVGLGRRLAK
ncbi:HWE histidine kinase domain-containing protein [Novosphingobium sp.]|uniref:sensor histidine kinase n=1 Tax=Novosphingobium sp. TaxID=1874826 RepID=UPI0025FEA8FE|nr:HWE histidine kinase domain-containing protein [Novosphingobium sp.]